MSGRKQPDAQLCGRLGELIKAQDVQASVTDKKKRAERREQQALEVEANQKALRESIAETERLVGESEEMLRRHRRESEDDDR